MSRQQKSERLAIPLTYELLVLVDCVTASLYYPLHTDTPPKPIRGDASSLLSVDSNVPFPGFNVIA